MEAVKPSSAVFAEPAGLTARVPWGFGDSARSVTSKAAVGSALVLSDALLIEAEAKEVCELAISNDVIFDEDFPVDGDIALELGGNS